MKNNTLAEVAATVKMNTVKFSVGFIGLSDNTFKMEFIEAQPKGEKFDRENAVIFGSIEFDTSELPESIFKACHAASHGLKQKMCDNLAMRAEDKEKTSLQTVIDMSSDLWEQLKSGHWNAPSKAAKAPSIKLSDMEAQFLAGVTAGITTYEAANALYASITGKTLPIIEA